MRKFMDNKRNIDNCNLIEIKNLNLPTRYKNAIIIIVNKLLELKEDLKITHLFLFGSCSRGNIRQGSDIDILLLTNSENEKEIRCKLIYNEIDTPIYNIEPQVTVRNLDRYLNINDNIKFHNEIYKDLKLLWRDKNE